MAWIIRCLDRSCAWKSDTLFEDHAKEWKQLHQTMNPGHRVVLMWSDLASKTVVIDNRSRESAA
jgi:hypothetical protein